MKKSDYTLPASMVVVGKRNSGLITKLKNSDIHTILNKFSKPSNHLVIQLDTLIQWLAESYNTSPPKGLSILFYSRIMCESKKMRLKFGA